MSVKTYKIEADNADSRLDRWFRRNVADIPQGLLQKYLRKGAIKVSGKKQEGSYRLKAGDEVVVASGQWLVAGGLPETESKKKKTSHLSLATSHWVKDIQQTVIYKNADIIAINKPSGLAVQGGSGISISVDDLLPYLQFEAKEKPRLVHRLDKDTSGVLLLARNLKSAAYLSEGFKGKDIEKTYWALVVGVPEKREGEISMKMMKKWQVTSDKWQEDSANRELRTANFEKMREDEFGKNSKTIYRVIESIGKQFSVLELKPLTGRTHQLRVHCAYMGFPIFGDDKYGERNANLQSMSIKNKLHLHARKITLKGRDGKLLTITAPLTGYMKETWKALAINEK